LQLVQALLKAMPDAAGLCELDGTIVAANAETAKLIGKPLSELPGTSAYDFGPPWHGDLRRANTAEMIRTKQPMESTFEHEGVRRRTRIHPVLDEAGEVTHFAIYSADISAVRKAETDLYLTQLRLATLLRNLPQVVLYETGGGREFISENIVNLLGFPAAEFTKDRNAFPRLIHPDDNAKMKQQLNAWHAAGEPEPLRLVFRCRNAAGMYVWLEDLMVEVRPEGAKPYMAGIITDITERKHAEAALEQSEANLALAQQLAQFGHWEYTYASGSLQCSAELLRIFGVAAQEFSKREDFIKRVHPQDVAQVESVLERARATEETCHAEYRILRPDGVERYVHATARVLHDSIGNPARTMGTVQDITEIHEAQKALRTSELKAAELAGLRMTAATYAHEINNPLTGILALLQMLKEQDCSPEQHEMLAEAQTAATRIRDVTSKLQTISHPEWRAYMKDSRIIDLRD